MIRRPEALLAGLLALAVLPAAAAPRPVVLSGQVRAKDAEVIYAPFSQINPVTLRFLAPEGAAIKPGDLLVRIDASTALSQQESLQAQIVQTRARIAKELVDLQLRELDARIALVDAEAALAKAEVDAAIPADYIARIDADRYAGELRRATRELALKQEELRAAAEAVGRRREDGELEIAKMQADLDFANRMIALAEQRAVGEGVAVFDFNAWSGQRYEEGASANAGQAIGQVVREGEFAVRAYALEPDRRGLAEGQAVRLRFDALPGRELDARITAIGGTPQAKAEWGAGRYFVVDIALPAGHGLPLKPGMNVRVAATPAAVAEAAP